MAIGESPPVEALGLRLALLPFGLLTGALALSIVGVPADWPYAAASVGCWRSAHIWTVDLMIEPVPRWGYGVGVAAVSLTLLLFTLGYTLRNGDIGNALAWRRIVLRTAARVWNRVSADNSDADKAPWSGYLARLRESCSAVNTWPIARADRTNLWRRRDASPVEAPLSRRQVKPDLVAPKATAPNPMAAKQPKLDLRSPDDGFQRPPLELIDDAHQVNATASK